MARSNALRVLLVWVSAASAQAAIPGYVEDFNDGTDAGFSGGSTVTSFTDGGIGGAGDGFISITELSPAQLGVRTSRPEFTGTLVADGVTGFSFALNDVGNDDDVEIHVAVGQAFANVWLHSTGLLPPENSWQEYSVDVTDSAGWVQIIGTGTFEEAVANTNRLLFRHDTSPFEQFPTPIAADFGLDRVTVLPEPWVGMIMLAGAPFVLQRRRAANRV